MHTGEIGFWRKARRGHHHHIDKYNSDDGDVGDDGGYNEG